MNVILEIAKRALKRWDNTKMPFYDTQVDSMYWDFKHLVEIEDIEGIKIMLDTVLKFLIKYNSVKNDVVKALSAGNYNAAPSTLTGGTSLMTEDRDGLVNDKPKNKRKKKKGAHKGLSLNKGTGEKWFNGNDLDMC